MKRQISTELCYVLGIITLAVGTALVAITDLGVSMIVAPAYLIHIKMSAYFPFFTFGMSEYILQGLLLVVMCLILRKFQITCLVSFATAVLYGLTLDGFLFLLSDIIVVDNAVVRYVVFFAGMLLATLGISFFFHSYISPEAYELFEKSANESTSDTTKLAISYPILNLYKSILYFEANFFTKSS